MTIPVEVLDVIAPYVTGTFKRDERIAGIAEDLRSAGLLASQQPTTTLPPQEAAANLLQCRLQWPVAERIAAELAERGLLTEEVR